MTVEPSTVSGITLSYVLQMVMFAPIFEEITVRYSWGGLCKGVFPAAFICIASGAFFALMHLRNIQGFISVFIGGVIFAYAYLKTGNLLYTILAHAIHNALCFIPLNRVYIERNGFVLCKWWYALICAVLLAVSILWYVKVFRKKYCAKTKEETL